jgi:hypothetical protein
LNLYYCHKFPMKHLLHLNKLWTIHHFMSIQTIYVACIRTCFLFFWLCWVASIATIVGYSFFLHVSTLWLVIPQFVQYLLIFFALLYVFNGVAYFVFYGIDNAPLALAIIIPSSHNIVASSCYWNVNNFILVVTILKYDCKLALNTTIKKLFVVGTCKPRANFWICS